MFLQTFQGNTITHPAAIIQPKRLGADEVLDDLDDLRAQREEDDEREDDGGDLPPAGDHNVPPRRRSRTLREVDAG